MKLHFCAMRAGSAIVAAALMATLILTACGGEAPSSSSGSQASSSQPSSSQAPSSQPSSSQAPSSQAPSSQAPSSQPSSSQAPSSQPSSSQSPSTPDDDGIVWVTSENGDGTATLYGYSSEGEKPSGDLVIPSVINGQKITKIGNSCFFDGQNMDTEIKSVTIPSTVTEIGEYAFAYCSEMTSVDLPNSLTQIDDYAFYNCISLSNLSLPQSIRTIGAYAFGGTIIETLVLPEGLKTVGGGAFSNMYIKASLVSKTDPDKYMGSVEYGLKQVTILGNTNFESLTFQGCELLNKVTFSGQASKITSLPDGMFDICTALSDVTLPSKLTSIGYGAFEDCTELTSIQLPSSVKTISHHAFSRTGLTEITLPSSLTTLGFGAFQETNLTQIAIPAGIKSIGTQTFFDCKSLKKIYIPSSVTTIKARAFATSNGSAMSVDVAYGGSESGWKAVTIDSSNTGLSGNVEYNSSSAGLASVFSLF